jgi:hypothetical protein
MSFTLTMQPINFIASLVTIYSSSYLLIHYTKKTFMLSCISSEPLLPFICLLSIIGPICGITIGINNLINSIN